MNIDFLFQKIPGSYSITATWFSLFNFIALLLGFGLTIRFLMLPNDLFCGNILSITAFYGSLLTLSGGIYSFGKTLDRKQMSATNGSGDGSAKPSSPGVTPGPAAAEEAES